MDSWFNILTARIEQPASMKVYEDVGELNIASLSVLLVVLD